MKKTIQEQDNKGATFEGWQDNTEATFKEAQDNTGATFEGWQYNTEATFKEEQDNERATFKEAQNNGGATFEGWQDNTGATFKEAQNNIRATFQEDILIKNMIIGDENTEISKAIKEFSKDKEFYECTLTAFYEWVNEQ
jgi:hypothetical protein